MAKIVSSGKALHSSEFHEKKRKEKRVRWGLYVFLTVLIIAVPVFLLRWERFRINQIEVTGTSVVSVVDVERVILSVLNEHYLGVVPKNNDILIPRRAIRKALLQELPRIRSVDFDILDTKHLGIHVEERTPFALYCREVQSFLEARGCFFLDEEGFIFAPAPAFSGEVYFIYTGGGNLGFPVGESFMSPERFVEVIDFLKSLVTIGVEVKAFELVPGTSINKSQYRLRLSDATPVFWYADEDLGLIRADIEILISTGVLNNKVLPLDNIEYLDLTIPNKPYWKIKNNE